MSGYMLKMSRSFEQQAVASFFSQLELILLIIVTISRDLFMCTSLLSVPSKYSSSSLSSTYCGVESTYNTKSATDMDYEVKDEVKEHVHTRLYSERDEPVMLSSILL